jgi:RNA recognition motif. (a.k.a. RRM, RBD, or RNP domain)
MPYAIVVKQKPTLASVLFRLHALLPHASPRGFAFVTMSSGADEAIQALNETEFMGRTIRVNEAQPPGSGGGGGGGYRGGGGGGVQLLRALGVPLHPLSASWVRHRRNCTACCPVL